jgi:hypothetical protein
LVRIRARRVELDLVRANGFPWPAERRLATMLPFSRGSEAPKAGPGDHVVSRVRIIVH